MAAHTNTNATHLSSITPVTLPLQTVTEMVSDALRQARRSYVPNFDQVTIVIEDEGKVLLTFYTPTQSRKYRLTITPDV